jgi:hypothetical protein
MLPCFCLSDRWTVWVCQQVAPDEQFDWAIRYQDALRAAPLVAGGLGIVAVLVNRLMSGVRSQYHLLGNIRPIKKETASLQPCGNCAVHDDRRSPRGGRHAMSLMQDTEAQHTHTLHMGLPVCRDASLVSGGSHVSQHWADSA